MLYLLFNHKNTKGTDTQNNYTTKNKHLTIDSHRLTEFNRLSDVFSKEHIYYTHPYASWKRSTNENHNRSIRRWFPKGTKKTTPKEVAFIENWINIYPKNSWTTSHPESFFLLANLKLKFSKNVFTLYFNN